MARGVLVVAWLVLTIHMKSGIAGPKITAGIILAVETMVVFVRD